MISYIPLLLPVLLFLFITFGVLVGNAGIKSLREAESNNQQVHSSKNTQ